MNNDLKTAEAEFMNALAKGDQRAATEANDKLIKLRAELAGYYPFGNALGESVNDINVVDKP